MHIMPQLNIGVAEIIAGKIGMGRQNPVRYRQLVFYQRKRRYNGRIITL